MEQVLNLLKHLHLLVGWTFFWEMVSYSVNILRAETIRGLVCTNTSDKFLNNGSREPLPEKATPQDPGSGLGRGVWGTQAERGRITHPRHMRKSLIKTVALLMVKVMALMKAN